MYINNERTGTKLGKHCIIKASNQGKLDKYKWITISCRKVLFIEHKEIAETDLDVKAIL